MEAFTIEKLGSEVRDRARFLDLLCELDATYVPPVSALTDLPTYCEKLIDRGEVFLLRSGGGDAGLLALYANDTGGRCAFISSIGVKPAFRGRGAGALLMAHAAAIARARGMERLRLEVCRDNRSAVQLYLKHGFAETAVPAVHAELGFVVLEKTLVPAASSAGGDAEAP